MMNEESKDWNNDHSKPIEQSLTEVTSESATLVLPEIEDSLIVVWPLPNTKFREFLLGDGLEQGLVLLQQIVNKEI